MERQWHPDSGDCRTGIGLGIVPLFKCFAFAREKDIPQIVDADSLEKPILEEIRLAAERIHPLAGKRIGVNSLLETFDIRTAERRTLRVFNRVVEAPNWMKDGDTLLYNSQGRLWKYSISRDEEREVPTGECDNCNNEHVISSDGEKIGFSNFILNGGLISSHIYVIPSRGGEAVRVTLGDADFLHGWAPEKDEIVWCAVKRKNNAEAVRVQQENHRPHPYGVVIPLLCVGTCPGGSRGYRS